MEWTFDRLRELAKETGVEFVKGTLVAPPRTDPSWSDCLTFSLVGKLGELRVELYDNNLTDGKRAAPYVRLGLNNFYVVEPVLVDDFPGVLAAVSLLVDRWDVKKVVASGGVDKLKAAFWDAVRDAVKKAGGTAVSDWAFSKGELPGYGKYESGHHVSCTVETAVLSRNKEEFDKLEVDLLRDDFTEKAKQVVALLKAKKEDRKKKKKNTPLYERLNELKVSPEVENGKVVALVDTNGEHLRQAELEELGLDPEDLGTVEPHPEGADRGGYLPEVGGAQWDETACEWQ